MSHNNSTKSNLTSIALILTFGGLAIAATPITAATLAPTESASRFDVRFLQETTGHHMMAVEMGQLCVQKAIYADLRSLCQNIITTQSQEIATMQSWLKDWYGFDYMLQMRPGDMRMLEQMAMMSGAEFEIDFMQEMTDHHKSMLSDAVPCTSRAGHGELVSLCQNIIAAQSSEINQFQEWLSQRYGISNPMNEPISNHADGAVIVNDGFETGDFTGWSTIGKAEIKTADFGIKPAEGTYYAALSTMFDTVPGSNLESFLGLAPGSLNALGQGNIEQGSAIKKTFTAKAGDVLTFDWNFMTNELESTLVGSNKDFAFLTLSPLPSKLADTSASFVTSLTPFLNETGFQAFSTKISTAGIYTFGFGVVNVGDPMFDSALAVDNVKLAAVPEPTSVLGILALGALGAGSMWQRKQKQNVT